MERPEERGAGIAFSSACFLIVAILLVALSVVLTTERAAAHGDRVIPPPEECQVAPRSDLAGASLQDPPTAFLPETLDSKVARPFVMPLGPPAGDDVRLAIATTVRDLLACENAGNSLRQYALYSDGYLAHQLADQGPGGKTVANPPAPAPEEARAALLAIEDVQLLTGGRIGALVHFDRASDPAPEEAEYVTFTMQDGRWLIDSVIEQVAEDRPVIAAVTLLDAAGTQVGTATLSQKFGGRIWIETSLDGVPPGGHAVHIHQQTGSCDQVTSEPVAATNVAEPLVQTWNLGNAGSDTAGRGEFYASSIDFTLSPGPMSLFGAGGSVLVLHAGMDNELPPRSGNSGDPIACGVIQLQASSTASGSSFQLLVLATIAVGGGIAGLLGWQLWRHRHLVAQRQPGHHPSASPAPLSSARFHRSEPSPRQKLIRDTPSTINRRRRT